MKAWEIIGYFDDAAGFLCDECGDENVNRVIFASDGELLENGEWCDRCHAVWNSEDFEWRPAEQSAVERLEEAINARGR